MRGETYEGVKKDSGATLQASLVVVIVSIATVVGQVLAGEEAAGLIGWLALGIVRGVVSWALWALVIWIIGTKMLRPEETEVNKGQEERVTWIDETKTPETEKTEAGWVQLARVTGFAQTPGLLNLYGALQQISLLAFLWTFAAMVIAVREGLGYESTRRAFFVILLAAIPVFIMNIIVFALTGGGAEVESP